MFRQGEDTISEDILCHTGTCYIVIIHLYTAITATTLTASYITNYTIVASGTTSMCSQALHESAESLEQ